MKRAKQFALKIVSVNGKDKMKIQEIYTEKFLDEIPEENYLLHKPVEEWNDRDWVAWGEVVNA